MWMKSIIERVSLSSLCDRGLLHIRLAVNSCTGTSIGLQTNDQEIVQVIRMWGLGQHAYWVLVLIYVGLRATHFTGYCYWFDVEPRATHFTGYCCWLMWGHGQHTLLGSVVGLCASGDTSLGIALGLCGPRATHLIGYCCWSMWGIVVGYVAPRASTHTGFQFHVASGSE
jgi:hypothetical protein